ncbi:MAG TPA: allantoate amidohydrolase, partial [Terrabacter sp.]|nr:allantoate amidohydrolase [Terrabacter sp.]
DAAAARGVKGVVAGSHLDSVPDGGAFDGPLGVVSALATVDALRAAGVEPDVPIGVVNFVDEEGARFGIACAGSRIITGALDADRARALTDGDGVSMAEAWRRAGRDPRTLGPDEEALRRVGHFVELHVEQGKALAVAPDGGDDLTDPTRAVAIGTDIWPHGRWRIDLPGEANHAGTTRMADRHDAMLGLATVVQSARSYAVALGCVATVGKVDVVPGGVNAIPSHVTAWLDARGEREEAVRAAVDAVAEEAGRFGAITAEESWTPTTTFDAGLVDRLHGILPDAPLLGTGAGHDAGILATHGVPSGMLFVRNPTGVSHSPSESASVEDCHHGVMALTAVVTDLCTVQDAEPTGGNG